MTYYVSSGTLNSTNSTQLAILEIWGYPVCNQIFLNVVIEHQAYHSTQQTENLPMLEELTKSETQSRNVQQHSVSL